MKKIQILLLILFTIVMSGCEDTLKVENGEKISIENEVQSTVNPVSNTVQENGMEISITYGYENNVKLGRDLAVYINVYNKGDDFEGSLQMFVRKGNEDEILYQKDVSVKSNERKRVYLTYCEEQESVRNYIRFVNKDGKVIVKKSVNIKTVTDKSKAFIGILTEETSNLGYLSDKTAKIFYLTEETLGENDQCLDTLDIIVINNFDTKKLSERQRAAIADWVNKGGTVVIGTGRNISKTLTPLKEVLKINQVEKSTKAKTAGMDSSVSNSKTVGYGNEGKTMQVLRMGLGTIQIFPVDLGLEYNDWSTEGSVIYTSIWHNLSTDQKKDLAEEGLTYDTSVYQGITAYGTDKTPFVSMYAVILLLYLVLIGPILYLVLKKLDCRNLMWGLVPIFSLVFSFVIYFISGETRITKPYIGYLSFLHLDGQGKGNGVEETYFSITVPSNKQYTVSIPDEYAITAHYSTNTKSLLNSQNDETEDTAWDEYKEEENLKMENRSKTAVKIKDDVIDIEMKNYEAFTTGYFKSKMYKEESGTYKYHISNQGNLISGTFTNNLNYDLEDVTIFTNHTLMPVGEISSGETAKIGDRETFQIVSKESIYEEDVVRSLIGSYQDIQLDDELLQKYYAYVYCFNSSYERLKNESCLIGFVDNDSSKSGLQGVDLKQTGMQVVVIPLEVNTTQGEVTYVSNIETYINSIIEGGYDMAYRELYEKVTIIEYQFDQNDTIKGIYYEEELNEEIKHKDSENIKGFYGNIYAYNFTTAQYDLVFISGVQGEFTELDYYIDANKKMILKYEADDINETRQVLPVLSVEKIAE